MMGLNSVVHTRSDALQIGTRCDFPMNSLPRWLIDPITWGRSTLSGPHHAFKPKTKLHTGYVLTLSFLTASDILCIFLQHPVVGATNGMGQFCYA